MRTRICRKIGTERALCLATAVMALASRPTSAQTNSWTSPTSGHWEDMSWSLGILPGPGQTILVANHGWKAVAIGPNTAANYPQTLSIDALNIISPGTDTVNTVLLNYAGFQTPLTIAKYLYVSNNTSMVILQSAVQANGVFYVGGTVTHDVSSQVASSSLLVMGGGAYNFTNGTLTIPNSGYESVDGQFVQAGGSNFCGSLHVDGEFDLSGGQLVVPLASGPGGGTVDFGNFVQSGGSLDSELAVGVAGERGGIYHLSGGFLHASYLGLPALPGNGTQTNPDTSYMNQTDGTNVADYMEVGQQYVGDPLQGFGTYSLTNGLVVSSTLIIRGHGAFYQYGGVHSNASMTLSQSEFMAGPPSFGDYFVPGYYYLNGGTFTSDTVSGQPGVFSQTAGSCQITTLQITGGQYSLSGGQLTASDITLSNGANFVQSGGTVTQSGTLTLANANLTAGPGTQQFGKLLLNGDTNSTLTLSPGASALHFADSSSMTWSGAALIISNWNGSSSGGGSQQIFFGTSASGLTAQQLSQVEFSNPAGSPNGTYPARILSDGEVVPGQGSSSTSGPVNSWINPISGNWDQPLNWSLGVLPDSSQAVMITNSGWKAVAINPSTPITFPGSMTVSNLMIRGATNTENTLLLNSFGTAVPLTVLNGLTLQDGAQILNFNSGLAVQGGTFLITNSDVIQDGGFVRATNVFLSGSEYDLTNGDFDAGSVSLGYPVSAHFNQYGGSVIITNLGMASYVLGTNVNGYSLYGGTLQLPGGMFLLGQAGGLGYFQAGGTNQTTQVTIEPDYGGFVSGFVLNGGLLADSGVQLMAGYETPINIEQNGGSHVITNTLLIQGYSPHGFDTDPATYYMNSGTLSAGVIELDANEGDSIFAQSNATVSVGTIYTHSLGYFGSLNTHVTLAGGTLSCSSYTNDDGGGQFNQSGGALVVSNLLSFGGSRDLGNSYIYGVYTFTGGTVAASNINISANWIIGDGSANRISNPGFFSLSHLLVISNAVEQLGRFILASNATIDLAGSASQLSFANSSGQTWTGGETLVISDWNGNVSGGGTEQLKFGTDQSGLTPAQLGQIQFHLGTNSYSAKILNTGEVVPDQVISPGVTYSMQGNSLVLSWPSGWSLQTATNPAGPYSDVTGATSPYTNDMTHDRQRFFRLQQ